MGIDEGKDTRTTMEGDKVIYQNRIETNNNLRHLNDFISYCLRAQFSFILLNIFT